MACAYFAKDLPRLMRQKSSKNWEKYSVLELRGATLGIVGYGDIGRACAKLARVYGMKIVVLRRNPSKAEADPYCDVVYGSDKASLNQLFAESDYILCSAPLVRPTHQRPSQIVLFRTLTHHNSTAYSDTRNQRVDYQGTI